MNEPPPWDTPAWIEWTQILLDSHNRLVGHELIARDGSVRDQARGLFEAPRVVVSHNTAADPILNYANQAALDLWETPLEVLLATPSRETAEAVHRDERAQLLERTARDGYVDDYRGVRISRTGRRFLIERATVWNLHDANGQFVGQAASFSEWTWLEGTASSAS